MLDPAPRWIKILALLQMSVGDEGCLAKHLRTRPCISRACRRKCNALLPVHLVRRSQHCTMICSNEHKGLGLLTLPPNIILHNPIANVISIHILHRPVPASAAWGSWGLSGPVSPEVTQLCALVGVFSCAISMAYAISIYHGLDEWVYMSIPGRLGVAVLGLTAWALNPRLMSPLLFSIIVWDGSVALITGWTLGTWSGRRRELVVPRTAKSD
jgi:hypothetical protein